MADWAIVVMGIPLGIMGTFFGWLLSRQYLKLLMKREQYQRKELELRERELRLNEEAVDREWKFRERELEYKFQLLEHDTIVSKNE